MFKKAVSILLSLVMVLSLAACGSSGTESTSESESTTDVSTENTASNAKYDIETPTVRVSYAVASGMLYQFIASEKGYLEEEGLDVEEVTFENASDAFSALDAETTDVLMTYSTEVPLNRIANGGDYTIFAGYMAQGATPLFTMEDTEYNDIDDLVGKKIGISVNGGGTEALVLKRVLKDAGYDLDKDFEWVEFTTPMEAIEGVKNGDMDFSFCLTGFETVREQYGMKDVFYPYD